MRYFGLFMLAALFMSGNTPHEKELLLTVHHAGVYCDHGQDIPEGYVRIARVRMKMTSGNGGCTHDIYVPSDRLDLIYWPIPCGTAVVEKTRTFNREGYQKHTLETSVPLEEK